MSSQLKSVCYCLPWSYIQSPNTQDSARASHLQKCANNRQFTIITINSPAASERISSLRSAPHSIQPPPPPLYPLPEMHCRCQAHPAAAPEWGQHMLRGWTQSFQQSFLASVNLSNMTYRLCHHMESLVDYNEVIKLIESIYPGMFSWKTPVCIKINIKTKNKTYCLWTYIHILYHRPSGPNHQKEKNFPHHVPTPSVSRSYHKWISHRNT